MQYLKDAYTKDLWFIYNWHIFILLKIHCLSEIRIKLDELDFIHHP